MFLSKNIEIWDRKSLHFEFTENSHFHENFFKIFFLGANIDENGTTSIPGGLCQSQKLSLANQSLRGSKLNISGLSESDSFLWLIELSINEQGSVMQIRGQAIEGGGYPNLIASQTGCFITHQLLDFKRSLPLKGKQFLYLYFVPLFRTRYATTPVWPHPRSKPNRKIIKLKSNHEKRSELFGIFRKCSPSGEQNYQMI